MYGRAAMQHYAVWRLSFCRCRETAAQPERRIRMSGATIAVVVIVLVYLAVMGGIMIYINTGKKEK